MICYICGVVNKSNRKYRRLYPTEVLNVYKEFENRFANNPTTKNYLIKKELEKLLIKEKERLTLKRKEINKQNHIYYIQLIELVNKIPTIFDETKEKFDNIKIVTSKYEKDILYQVVAEYKGYSYSGFGYTLNQSMRDILNLIHWRIGEKII